MKRVMVRYKVKPDRADENERYIKDVFEQLAHARPSGLRYASFKLADGVSFVHIVSYDDAGDSRNALRELPAFQAFTTGIKERCDEPPLVADLSEVGSYRMFGD
jgi:quinol monooxygenase YgiN